MKIFEPNKQRKELTNIFQYNNIEFLIRIIKIRRKSLIKLKKKKYYFPKFKQFNN
jgi:hypothetical protein